MKRFCLHIVCLALASYFIVAGCGINVAHYCCEACAEHGMRMFSTSSCEEVHHNHLHHEHTQAHCCEHHHKDGINHQHNACTLQRFATDIPTDGHQHLDFAPHAELCAIIPLVVTHYAKNQHKIAVLAAHAPPQSQSGRTLLSNISLLLI